MIEDDPTRAADGRTQEDRDRVELFFQMRDAMTPPELTEADRFGVQLRRVEAQAEFAVRVARQALRADGGLSGDLAVATLAAAVLQRLP